MTNNNEATPVVPNRYIAAFIREVSRIISKWASSMKCDDADLIAKEIEARLFRLSDILSAAAPVDMDLPSMTFQFLEEFQKCHYERRTGFKRIPSKEKLKSDEIRLFAEPRDTARSYHIVIGSCDIAFSSHLHDMINTCIIGENGYNHYIIADNEIVTQKIVTIC